MRIPDYAHVVKTPASRVCPLNYLESKMNWRVTCKLLLNLHPLLYLFPSGPQRLGLQARLLRVVPCTRSSMWQSWLRHTDYGFSCDCPSKAPLQGVLFSRRRHSSATVYMYPLSGILKFRYVRVIWSLLIRLINSFSLFTKGKSIKPFFYPSLHQWSMSPNCC